MTAPAAVAALRKNEPKTAVEMWKRRVAASAGKPAFQHKVGAAWTIMTYAEADAVAREIAAGLIAQGVVPGDRICVLAQTRLEWVLCDLGILLAGAVTVPIYASNTPEQCEFIIRDAGAKVVILEDAAQIDKLIPLRHRLFTVMSLVHMAGDATLERPDAKGRTFVPLAEAVQGAADFVQSLEGLRAAGRAWTGAHPDELDKHSERVGPDSTFTIIYTSGTTGTPKGVVLTHENLASGVCSAVRAMSMREDDQQYLFLPLAHVLGRELEWAPIEIGCLTTFSQGTAKIKDDLTETRPTFMAGVPRIFEKFHSGVLAGLKQGSPAKLKLIGWAMRVGAAASARQRAGKMVGPWLGLQRAVADKLVFSKLRAKLGLDRCRFLISGGAPLGAEIGQFFHGVGVLILEGYGLTETMAAAFLNRIDHFRFGTVGPALDVVELRFADDGEILMRGPSVFRQYYNNSTATAESVEPDGWFHSGDIGMLEDGLLRITDRKKDLIVTAGGKKVAPQPLENAIKARSPLVSQALVYGDKRPYCVALLTSSEEAVKRFGSGDASKLSESAPLRAEVQKAIDALNATLASYETIKRFAILPAEFSEAAGELTPSLKVKRKVVIDKYGPAIEALYAGAGGGNE
ncbi:MAG TPA: long-chain fatty acid--CoA ligase [Polyangia bacterium]|jgi:long-chain acyl-CoA synthetase|nr:long-chain fatty acid--CoA ligase [Polyangia bacterium]